MICPSCQGEFYSDTGVCPFCGVQVPSENSGGDSGQSRQDMTAPLNLSECLTRPMKDPFAQKKVLTMALWGMIPIVGSIIVTGYGIDYCRRVLQRRDMNSLPEIDDISGFLGRGVMFFLASLIYGFVVTMLSGISAIPFVGSLAVLAGQIEKGSENPAVLGAIISAFLVPLSVLCLLASVVYFIAPMLAVFYSRNLQFADAFKFGDALKLIFSDFVAYVIALLALFAVSFVGFSVGGIFGIIPLIGWLISWYVGALMALVMAVLGASVFGEFYFKFSEKLMKR